MTSSSLIGVLIGLLLLYQGEAAMNLLGEKVTHPLIKWDFYSLIKVLSRHSEAWKSCEENNRSRIDILVKRADVIRCRIKLQPAGAIDYDDFDMDYACRQSDKYTKCMRNALKAFQDFCDLTGEVGEYVENAGKIHTEISKLMCKDNQTYYKDFEENGKACVKSKETELMKCSEDHSEDDMEYKTDDCVNAWGFVECVEDTLEDCEEHASEAVVKIMSKGLNTTDCEFQRESP